MAAAAGPTPTIADPPEDVQGDGPGDAEMYEAMRARFGERLDGIDEDILPRFVRGYATEEKRMEVTTERIEFYLTKRDEWNFPTIIDENWEEFEECARTWEVFLYGQNKFGHVLVWDRVGCSDVATMRRVFLDNQPETKIKRYRYQVQAETAKYKKGLRLKYNKMIYKHVLIFDLYGFTTSHFSGGDIRNAVKEVITEEQHLFPETLHKLYIINAPFVFRAAWSVIGYFVDPITYEKVKVLGSGYLSELQKEIADDQIPRKFGGTGTMEIRLGRAATDEMDELLAADAAAKAGGAEAATADDGAAATTE